MFVGDLSRDKGIEVLLEAHRLGGLPRLVLAGRVLENTPLDLPGRVDLRGLLDHPSVIDLMQSASVVAVPSIVPDCCPTVILEAMALGRPVVAAASGGIVDLVDDGVTGLLVPPGEAPALSQCSLDARPRPRAGCGDGTSGARTRAFVHCLSGGRADRTALRAPALRLAAGELTLPAQSGAATCREPMVGSCGARPHGNRGSMQYSERH